jgi:hypothetical protein
MESKNHGNPQPDVPVPGVGAVSEASLGAVSKAAILSSKLKIAIGALSFVALVVSSVTYYFYDAEGSGPPTLQLDTASLSKGMMQDNRGLATFEGNEEFSCPSGKYEELSGRMNNVYSTKAVSFEDVYKSLKPEAGLKFLIAFYSPGEKVSGLDGKDASYDENTFYMYPTSKSPFKGAGDVKIKDVKLEDGNYVIPAYRGFKVMVSKDAKICGENFVTADSKDSKLKKSGKDYAEDLLQNLSALPKGWVMIPVAADKDALKRTKDVVGDYFDQGYLQSGVDDFEKIDSFSSADPKFRMVWFEMNEGIDTAVVLKKFLEAEAKMNESNKFEGVKKEVKVYDGEKVVVDEKSADEKSEDTGKDGESVVSGNETTSEDKEVAEKKVAAEGESTGEGEGNTDVEGTGKDGQPAVSGDETTSEDKEVAEKKVVAEGEDVGEGEENTDVEGTGMEGEAIIGDETGQKVPFSVEALLKLLEDKPEEFYALDFAGYDFAPDIALETQSQLVKGINSIWASTDLIIKDFISKIIPVAEDHVVAVLFANQEGKINIFPSKLADYFEDVVGAEDSAQLFGAGNFVLVTNHDTTVLGEYEINKLKLQMNSMSNGYGVNTKMYYDDSRN